MSNKNLPSNFNWIIPGKLAGSSNPNSKELQALRDEGINSIVCLQQGGGYDEPRYSPLDATDTGLKYLWIPIPDFMGPSKDQIQEFIDFVDSDNSGAVCVHCYAGRGRTGTLIAVYLAKKEEIDPDEAIKKLRKIWNRYVETADQEKAIKKYFEGD